jgi:hypothetical protein
MQDVPLDVRRDNGVTLDLDWSEFEDTQPYSVPAPRDRPRQRGHRADRLHHVSPIPPRAQAPFEVARAHPQRPALVPTSAGRSASMRRAELLERACRKSFP